MDLLLYSLLRLFVGTLRTFNINTQLLFMRLLVRLVFSIKPSYTRICRINIRQVYPDQDEAFADKLILDTQTNIARIVVDIFRIPDLSLEWSRANVEVPRLSELEQLKKRHPDKGILFVTGHLGSFPILIHVAPFFGFRHGFIARSLRLPRIDRWVRSIWEKSGNKVIDREGAIKVMTAELKAGKSIALPFDQNVTRNYAVFVDHFGRPAATTKALGICALRTEVPVVIATLENLPEWRYRINLEFLDLSSIYTDINLSQDQKIVRITEFTTKAFEKMILQHPQGWFWMHRRWKTAPAGEKEDFYK